MASHKELEKYYNKNRKMAIDFLQEDGYIKCMGCGQMIHISKIECHHIIKRSNLKYFYADIRNFTFLDPECHRKAEGTIDVQRELLCFRYMEDQKQMLMDEYNALPLWRKNDFIK